MPNFLTEDGVQLYYEVSGYGLPMIFIHPPHMNHTVFMYQRELNKNAQVILFDIAGHGKSSIANRNCVIESSARDIAHLLKYLSIDRAVIVGYSSGGSVAQQFALEFPEKVIALILSGGYPKVGTWILKMEYHIGLALVKHHKKRLLSKILAYGHRNSPWDEHILYESCMLADSKTVYQFYLESLYYNCTSRLKELKQPLLLIYGERSYYFHPHIKLYKKARPDSQVVFVSDAFHQLPTKKHHEFNVIIQQFVETLV